MKLKAYFFTIVGGLVVLASVVFVVLQWPEGVLQSTYSLYGKPIENVPTIWIILCAAVGGQVFIWASKMLIIGVKAIRAIRRRPAKSTGPSQAARQDTPRDEGNDPRPDA